MTSPPTATRAATPDDETPQLRIARERLSCQLTRDLEQVAELRPEWDRLAASVGAGIVQSYDWCHLWWQHYGGDREPCVFLLRDDDALVGVVPMCIDRVRIGPAHLRVAKVMGTDFSQTVYEPAVQSAWAPAVWETILPRLFEEEGCEAVHLGPIPDGDPCLEAVRGMAKSHRGLFARPRDRVVARRTIVNLPETFDEYLQTLSRNQRSNLRRMWNRLRDGRELTADLVSDPAGVRTEFEDLVDMHREQWEEQGKLGHFGDWPGAEAYNRSLVTTMSEWDRVRFLRLEVEGEAIARQLAFVFGGSAQCWLAARAADHLWQAYGVGRLSLARLFEKLIEQGVRRVDAGVGQYDYKTRLGGREEDVRSLLLVANDRKVRRRARAVRHLASLIDRFYYRLWFCRLAAKTPLPRKPLRESWIRSRI